MPIYAFECVGCRVAAERMQKIDEEPPRCCICGVHMTKRLTAPASFKFIGPGFYANDSKGK